MRRSDYEFLNEMDRTREERIVNRSGSIDIYRSEWNKYMSEWANDYSERRF